MKIPPAKNLVAELQATGFRFTTHREALHPGRKTCNVLGALAMALELTYFSENGRYMDLHAMNRVLPDSFLYNVLAGYHGENPPQDFEFLAYHSYGALVAREAGV